MTYHEHPMMMYGPEGKTRVAKSPEEQAACEAEGFHTHADRFLDGRARSTRGTGRKAKVARESYPQALYRADSDTSRVVTTAEEHAALAAEGWITRAEKFGGTPAAPAPASASTPAPAPAPADSTPDPSDEPTVSEKAAELHATPAKDILPVIAEATNLDQLVELMDLEAQRQPKPRKGIIQAIDARMRALSQPADEK